MSWCMMIYIYFLIIYYIGTTDYIQLVSSTHPIPLSIECKWALMGGKQVERLKVPRKYVSMYTYCGHTCMYVRSHVPCMCVWHWSMNWWIVPDVSTGMFLPVCLWIVECVHRLWMFVMRHKEQVTWVTWCMCNLYLFLFPWGTKGTTVVPSTKLQNES